VRSLQLAYIRDLIGGYKHQVLMGDMNTHASDCYNSHRYAISACWPADASHVSQLAAAALPGSYLLSPTLTLKRSKCWPNPFPITCRSR
jgi:endonuclease/exonuclease/phosphatase family metal-dependent hydrolase